jgi:hypothetical protein
MQMRGRTSAGGVRTCRQGWLGRVRPASGTAIALEHALATGCRCNMLNEVVIQRCRKGELLVDILKKYEDKNQRLLGAANCGHNIYLSILSFA